MFLDWCVEAGQSFWQLLPLTPTGPGGSPYGSHSAFAGNAMLISPDELVNEMFLPRESIETSATFSDGHVDLGRVMAYKSRLLRESWSRFERSANREARLALESFTFAPEQESWLDDWALYSALKNRFEGAEWLRWDRELAMRDAGALARARSELHGEVAFHKFVQFLFFRQWNRVREAAGARGIRIIGDVPIYVALDSADVWSRPELFLLNEEREPVVVAGVPPDYFSKTGQRWGNPLYRWDRLEEDGYDWWVSRLEANFHLADLVRLDHFRGFASYWEVPATEETAINGRWVKGPGIAFFNSIRTQLGDVPLIAEDLGDITPEVDALRKASGLPGMHVLQFGFGADVTNPHRPANHHSHAVVYTGTHDNDTTVGWYAELTSEERERLNVWIGHEETPIEWRMIRAAYESPAVIAMVPMQDVLGLGSEARMNVPGEGSDNWTWRATPRQFLPDQAAKLRSLAVAAGRVR